MTGREALRIVAAMPLGAVAYHYRHTRDATLRLVCGWRLDDERGFRDLAEMVGITLMDETDVLPTCVTITAVEQRHILWVLARSRSKTEAAALLGISLKTLYTKLHSYDVVVPDIPSDREDSRRPIVRRYGRHSEGRHLRP